MRDKVKVYVCSMNGISTVDFVDRESMAHACAVRDGKTNRVFDGLKHLPAGSWDGNLLDDQRRTVDVVREFCEENELEYEIVDIANLKLTNKMKLVFKGIKAPTIIFREKKIEGVPTKEDLQVLIAK